MPITVRDSGKLRQIGVLGPLDDFGDRAEVIAHFAAEQGAHSLQVDFYDAGHLSRDVILALAECQKRAPLKIVTYRASLTHCLIRLGFTCRPAHEQRQATPPPTCRALALAGSANSLPAIMQIVANLPPGEVSVFIVQHVAEDAVNQLDSLLRVSTDYRVTMPHHLVAIEPGTIYVAPPGHHLKLAHGQIYLTRDRKIDFARPSISVLFDSVASEYGDQALAVLCCGFGRDGVDGCAALKRAGAAVIVQDPDECDQAGSMPEALLDAGHCDHRLKTPAIVSVVAASVAGSGAEPAGALLRLFLDALWSQTGHDFRGYQSDSLGRRLRVLTSRLALGSFADFQRAVFADADLADRVAGEISVGVTELFRHPEQFLALRTDVLPYLSSFPVIKLWSAGCATGEEAYSLAILLDELGLLEISRLFATDSNPYLLDIAKNGLFSLKDTNVIFDNYLKSGGSGDALDKFSADENMIAISNYLVEQVIFHQHTLVECGVFNEFQVIMCRNVLIYFEAELQARILQCFARSLHRDGFLLLGPQDGLAHLARAQGFVPYNASAHIYRLGEGLAHG